MKFDLLIKKLYILISILGGILIIEYTDYLISTKILLIITQTFFNKYIINFAYNNVKLELEKLELDELQYLGLHPKVEISFMIILILFFYYIVVCYGILYDFIDKSLLSKIFMAIVFLLMFLYGLMGAEV